MIVEARMRKQGRIYRIYVPGESRRMFKRKYKFYENLRGWNRNNIIKVAKRHLNFIIAGVFRGTLRNILLFVQCFYLEKSDLFGLNYFKCYLPVTAPNIHTPTCFLTYHFLVWPARGI